MPTVIVKIYRDVDPMERYERYHKPLDAALRAAGYGEVVGGGTLEDLDSGETILSDLHVNLTGAIELGLGVIRAALIASNVPPDTELCVEGRDRAIMIGVRAH